MFPMSDPVHFNQNRIASAGSASRTTLEKLGKKSAPSKTDAPADSKPTARPAGSDSVNLSNVKERMDAQPDFDRVKVDAIKSALQQGNYPVNPRKIAENFVSLEKLLQG